MVELPEWYLDRCRMAYPIADDTMRHQEKLGSDSASRRSVDQWRRDRSNGWYGGMDMALVRSEIAGSVWKIEVSVGHAVAEGDVLIILESMKMEIPVEAPAAGVVEALHVAEGDPVKEGQTLVTLG